MIRIQNRKFDMVSENRHDLESTLERLEFDILSGVLRPRERLVEYELIKQYQVSRGTIRKVLHELHFKHLIEHFPNRGAVVAEPTKKEVEDVYHTRVLLETAAIDLVLQRIDDKTMERIVYYERIFADAVKEKNLRDIVTSNRLFHQTIFERCGNDVISEMIDQLRKRSHVWQHYIVGHSSRMEKTIKEHKYMVTYIRKQDVSKLKELNEKHLASGFQSYMEDLTVNHTT